MTLTHRSLFFAYITAIHKKTKSKVKIFRDSKYIQEKATKSHTLSNFVWIAVLIWVKSMNPLQKAPW